MVLETLFGYSPVIRPPAIGRVFFVASTGSNNNNGLDPGTPFQTITYALTQCVNDRNDYIVVLDNVSALEPAWPISVNVSRLHILGLSNDAYPYVRLESQTPGEAAFEIGSVQHYEIAGFELGAGDTTNACIVSIAGPGTAGRAWIHHCAFASLNGVLEARDGIHIQNTFDWCQSVVEKCLFVGPLAGSNGLTRDGIRIEGNATRSVFRDNIFKFHDTGGVGIHCIQNGSDIGAILRNYFICRDNAVGEAITMELGVGNAIIADNRAGEAAAAMANIPFRDLSTGVAATCLNAWVNNIDGIVALIPSVV